MKFNRRAKLEFLRHFAENGRVGHAAQAAGVSERTVRNHVRSDDWFAEAYEVARGLFRDRILELVTHLALDGIPRNRYDARGNLIETFREYPIRLIELLAKKFDPELRDKHQVDMNTQGGVLVVPGMLNEKEWLERFGTGPKAE